MWLSFPGPATARNLPQLQGQVRFHRRHLLHTRVRRPRVGQSRSKGSGGMNVQKIYEYALQREQEGKRFFESNAECMSHAAAAGIFRRLAAEEQKHIEFIERALKNLASGDADSGPAAELEPGERFARRADSEMLDQTVIESMIPDVSILRMAYLIERDFAEFYEMAASKTSGEAQTALAALARWEHGHERLFKELHDRVFQEYAGMPWGG
jgi:rubrerythrin